MIKGGFKMLIGTKRALLKAGDPRTADSALSAVLEAGEGPHRAQALYFGALAREATGDAFGAVALRRELREAHAGTPWGRRLAGDETERQASRTLQ